MALGGGGSGGALRQQRLLYWCYVLLGAGTLFPWNGCAWGALVGGCGHVCSQQRVCCCMPCVVARPLNATRA